jgi:hypothetical protein
MYSEVTGSFTAAFRQPTEARARGKGPPEEEAGNNTSVWWRVERPENRDILSGLQLVQMRWIGIYLSLVSPD